MVGIASGIVTADIISIGIGAIFGAIARYQIGLVASDYIATNPTLYSKYQGWHTSAINIGGSFLLGSIAGTPTTTATLISSSSMPTKNPLNSNTVNPLARRISSGISNNNKQLPTTPNSISSASLNVKSLVVSNKFSLSPRMKLCMGVGFCGAFTTFSTYSVDVVNWINSGQTKTALSYVAINNIGSISAAGLGMMIAKKLCG
jgi:protein CrcB